MGQLSRLDVSGRRLQLSFFAQHGDIQLLEDLRCRHICCSVSSGAIALSRWLNGWLGGVLESWRIFLPSAAVFFFIVVNVTTIRRLKIATLAAVASCLIVTVEALCGYYAGFQGEMFILRTNIYSPQDDVIGQLTRIRGAGFLSDPNDLAQILLIALPLAFIAWRRGRMVTNFFFVLVPAALLLWTTFLTHSRGGLLALAAVALMAARKKLGTTASTALAAIFILGMLALDFTGGRGISAADGADRLEAWANGLEMFKSAPLFGIGFNSFTDLYEITAHNSFVFCLAELGIVGKHVVDGITRHNDHGPEPASWSAKEKSSQADTWGFLHLFEASYIITSPLHSLRTCALGRNLRLDYTLPAKRCPPWLAAVQRRTQTESDPAYAPTVPKHWVVTMRLALVSFMTTSWFLSRSYTTTMYLILGLATATIALIAIRTKSSDRGTLDFVHSDARGGDDHCDLRPSSFPTLRIIKSIKLSARRESTECRFRPQFIPISALTIMHRAASIRD